VILKLISLVCELRASVDQEETGLDLTLHGEQAYPDFVGSGLVLGGLAVHKHSLASAVPSGNPAK
ncbi:MAG TPA: hypothetical protein VFF14_08870, partial [Candidatus Deferrimicrobium sp.]|nr:hypothetical protein [Candidatus Deferrimicrobium sp.]